MLATLHGLKDFARFLVEVLAAINFFNCLQSIFVVLQSQSVLFKEYRFLNSGALALKSRVRRRPRVFATRIGQRSRQSLAVPSSKRRRSPERQLLLATRQSLAHFERMLEGVHLSNEDVTILLFNEGPQHNT